MTPRFWILLVAGVFVLGCGIGLLLPRPQRERSFEKLEVNDLVDNYFRTHSRDFDTSFKKVCKPKEIEAPHSELRVHLPEFPLADYVQSYNSPFWDYSLRPADSLYIDTSKYPPDTMWRFQYEYKRIGCDFVFRGEKHLSKNIVRVYVPSRIMNSSRTGLKP